MRTAALRQLMLQVGLATCLISISTSIMTPVLAQSKKIDRTEFPGRRIGGGTRGECLIGKQPLVALNPSNNLGLTASDRPSVYFAVPKSNAAYPVQFVLRDTEGNSVYKTALTVSKNKEIVGVRLPKNTLKVGQDYHWYFSVVCDTEDSSQNIVVSGWLRRVSSPITSTSDRSLAARLDLVKSYQKAGLWLDAIATLVELRQTYARNSQVQLQWKQLLQALELEPVFQPSVVGKS